MTEPPFRSWLWVGILSGLAVLLAGCETSIDPFSGQTAYYVKGYLSTARQQQFIRVSPLNQPLSSDTSQSFEGSVTLENLARGSAETLQDSVVVFEDDGARVVTHNFWTETPIQPDTRYRLSVEGPYGTTTATTLTPTATQAETSPSDGHCLTTFNVAFPGVQDPQRIRASIEFDYAGRTFRVSPTESGYVPLHRGGHVVLSFEMERILSRFIDEVDDIRTFCWYEPRCLQLDDDAVTVHYTKLGPEWYGHRPSDSLRANPVQSRDVSDGLGFFGSLHRGQTTIAVETDSAINTCDS